MCIVETKIYIHPEGRRETIETTRRCRHAVGSTLCANVDRRSVEQALIVERKPATVHTPDGTIVIEGTGGRERVARDITHRLSPRSSVRHGKSKSDRLSGERSGSPSSLSYVSVEPPAPTPPFPGSPLSPRLQDPWEEPLSPGRIVAPDGTAVYDDPPSLDFPRALDNERSTMPPPLSRRASFSSLIAEVDDTLPRRSRRASLVVDTTLMPSSPLSSTRSSPGLSNLPRFGHSRHDSARSVPARKRRTSERVRFQDTPSSSSGARELDEEARRRRRRQDEEARQAQLERGRLAESDLRQARREAERNTSLNQSRERHRREAAEALEGHRDDERQRRHEVRQRRLDAEFTQMAREREEAAARQRDSADSAQYVSERRVGGVEAAASPRRNTNDGEVHDTYTASPISARSSTHPVQLHHYPSARRGSNAMYERGEQVIAREQHRAERLEPPFPADRVRRTSQRLQDVLKDVELEEAQADIVEEYGQGLRPRENRGERKDARRERRQQEFWK